MATVNQKELVLYKCTVTSSGLHCCHCWPRFSFYCHVLWINSCQSRSKTEKSQLSPRHPSLSPPHPQCEHLQMIKHVEGRLTFQCFAMKNKGVLILYQSYSMALSVLKLQMQFLFSKCFCFGAAWPQLWPFIRRNKHNETETFART